MASPTARTTLERLTAAIEHATWLDAPAEKAVSLLRRVLPSRGPIRDAASGTPIGHPAHPALVVMPIGAWSAATIFDMLPGRGNHKAARHLVGLGTLSALPSAVAGANDWVDTSGAERRVGAVHATLNAAALVMFFASWLARWRGRQMKGAAFSLAGLGTATASAWLGGHLAYGLGVGVDTTAFQHAPTEWTDVAAESALIDGKPVRVDAHGVPVMLVHRDGRVLALADRCTHRGGPLHEGSLDDNSVTCPLHGSRFSLADGSVCSGPATRPVPTFEVRSVEGRIQVRRSDEPRTLRTRPVGV